MVREANGDYILTSRLTGQRHYVPQTLDTIVDNGRVHPTTGNPIYSELASYAMGRADGQASTGLGPQQTGGVTAGFAHGDSMDCASCHSAWTNTCVGCHLGGEYDTNNNFSNITGERIAFEQADADFVYQSPVPFQIGVKADNKIGVIVPKLRRLLPLPRPERRRVAGLLVLGPERRREQPAQRREPVAQPQRDDAATRSAARATTSMEGARNCVACHLTVGTPGVDGLAHWGAKYDAFRTAMANDDFDALDFTDLELHFGRNPGNQLNSPLWVHAVAGLGSGLFLFDADGCAVNKLDEDLNRVGCPPGQAPKDNFDSTRYASTSTGSSTPPATPPGRTTIPWSKRASPGTAARARTNRTCRGPSGRPSSTA